jgi:hypothetical protein
MIAASPTPQPATDGPLRPEILTPPQVEVDQLLRLHWQRRVEASTSLYRHYQTPAWWTHLRRALGDDALRLIVLRWPGDGIAAVVPCARRAQPVMRRVAGRVIEVASWEGFDLLGSEPLADAQPEVYEALGAALWSAFPGVDVCWLKSLGTNGPFWQFLQSRGALPGTLHAVDGLPRTLLSIDLSEGWTGYQRRFNAKQRNDLSRKRRILGEQLGGEVSIDRMTTAAEVSSAHADLVSVSASSRQYTGRSLPERGHLVSAAEQGLLRAYLLRVGARPLAYVIGYQDLGVYHYSDVAFDDQAARLSPGTVLLYDIIRDVCHVDPVRTFNFGIGVAEYKRRFANVTHEDLSLYLLRRTIRNRLRHAALGSLSVLHRLQKRVKATFRAVKGRATTTVGTASAGVLAEPPILLG